MQSYYGSLPVAKRFEFTLCEGELQLSKGIFSARNGKILQRGGGQQQEESFRGATLVYLSDGIKIIRTRSNQQRQAERGFKPLANPAEYYFLGLPKACKRHQCDIAFRMPQAKKGTQCLGHVQRRDLLTCFTLSVKFDFSFSHAHGRCGRLAPGGYLIQYLDGPTAALPDVWIVEGINPELRTSQRGRNLPFEWLDS